MPSRDSITLATLIAFTMVNLGCPIMGPGFGKSAKTSRTTRTTIGVKSTSVVDLARSECGRSPTAQEDTSREIPPSAVPDGEPSDESPIVGFLVSVQPQICSATVTIPELRESARVSLSLAPRAAPVSRSPDTPPPRPVAG
jgi:hypothetical protein